MAVQAFCTKCGAPRAAGARFCTSCGASLSGAGSGASPAPGGGPSMPVIAVAMGGLLLTLGGVAAYFSLRTSTEVPRAVPGNAGAPPAAAPQAEGSLPSGHPSIDLPREVIDFLDGLTAEAEKNPQSIEAAQKLVRARYRASVINSAYRASAEQALAKLLALEPANAEGLRISANLAYDAGDYEEAAKRFEAFIAKFPDDASAITDLGSALLFQDRVDDAIKNYQLAIAKDGKFMQAHFNLGIALQKQGKQDESVASLRRALDLAETPDERQHIENALAEIEGREPMQIAGARGEARHAAASGAPSDGAAAGAAGATQGGMPMPPPAADRDVPTNASSDFQRQAEKPLITHPMIGPRLVAFEWKSPTSVRAKIADFPMGQMPPFARAKFKTSMTEKIAAVANGNGIAGAVTVELVDNVSGNVMDTLDTSAPPAPGTPQ